MHAFPSTCHAVQAVAMRPHQTFRMRAQSSSCSPLQSARASGSTSPHMASPLTSCKPHAHAHAAPCCHASYLTHTQASREAQWYTTVPHGCLSTMRSSMGDGNASRGHYSDCSCIRLRQLLIPGSIFSYISPHQLLVFSYAIICAHCAAWPQQLRAQPTR